MLALAGCPVAAGCLASSRDGSDTAYPVDGVADLAPLADDVPRIEGPVEFLANGMPDSLSETGSRTVAAYRVQIPAGVTAFVSLVSAASCTDREPLTSDDDPVPFQSLGLLRRVGDEAHFFAPFVRVGDRYIEVDTQTSIVYLSRNAPLPRIVLAVAYDDFRPLACGILHWR
jgi:hypothetical protein